MTDFDDTSTQDEAVIDGLSAGHEDVKSVLVQIMQHNRAAFGPLAIDLADMQMSGEQIWEAFNYCGCNLEVFVAACAARDQTLVDAVNAKFPDKPVRRGNQPEHVPAVMDAVRRGLKDAEEQGKLTRADQYGEAIHTFFTTVIFAGMQETQRLESNITINFENLEVTVKGKKVGWAVFAIRVAEFKGEDGEPIIL